jgi:hypothetical protein
MLAQSGFGALQSQHFSLPGILTSTSNVLNNNNYLIKQKLKYITSINRIIFNKKDYLDFLIFGVGKFSLEPSSS